MSTKKRGQITIFIVLGTILLLIFLVAYTLSNPDVEAFQTITQAENEVNLGFETCLRISSQQALQLLGQQGRLYSENYFEYGTKKAYYAYNKENTFADKQTIEQDLNKYINKNIQACLQNAYKEFKTRGLNLEEAAPSTTTIIAQNHVSFVLNIPLTFTLRSTGDETLSVDEFTTTHNVRLGYLLNVTGTIVDEWGSSTAFDMTYLDSLENIQTTILPYPDGTTTMVLEDTDSNLLNRPFIYVFALK